MDRRVRGAFSRRNFVAFSAATVLTLSIRPLAAAEDRNVTVYKSPSCGCCTKWADILAAAGFSITVRHVEDLSFVRRQAGVPEQFAGCHTALIGNYVVEGHVPVAAIEQMLREKPQIRGIAVPGMPAGSPGMGDDPNARFDVVAFGEPSGADAYIFFRAGA